MRIKTDWIINIGVILFLLLVCISSSYGQGRVEWTGDINNNWNNPGNWLVLSGSPMLPPAKDVDGDTVIIPSTMIAPVVMDGDSAFARKLILLDEAILTIAAGGVLIVENSFDIGLINAGLINNNGKTTIDSSYMDGVINQSTGSIINNGIFEILEGLGDRLKNYGTIINNASGQFLAGGGIGKGLINYPDASITNSGDFKVEYSHEDTLMINWGMIINHAGAAFTVDGGKGVGSILMQGSQIQNAGIFNAERSNGTKLIILQVLPYL